MANAHHTSAIQRWIGLGMAGAAFAACFSLFADAHAATGDFNPTLFTPGVALAGLLALAGGALWLISRSEERLW